MTAFGQASYRIAVPADGIRWKHTSVHGSNILVYLQQGTLPSKTFQDHWRNTGTNSGLSQVLGTWPWIANQSYFFTVTNTSSTAQLFTVRLDGRNCDTDDEDNDGLPDCWERQFFGGTGPTASTDFDNDGVSNLNEFLEATNPASNISLRPRLFLFGANGTVSANPVASNHIFGAAVTIEATPNANYEFLYWSGGASGNNNPLTLIMNSNRTVTAVMKLRGDDFGQRVPLTSWSNYVAGVTNSTATKEPGESSHAGNPGGKSMWWTWKSPGAGMATVATVGSTYNTLLGVYTGTTVSNLVLVASNANSSNSRVTFAAVAGETYQIAVDGAGGVSGTTVLQAFLNSQPVTIDSLIARPDGRMQLILAGPAGRAIGIEATTDLIQWQILPDVANPNGVTSFMDGDATNHVQRFYRAILR